MPSDAEAEVLLRLPDEHRHEFKDPLGPLFVDPDQLLETAGRPIITVGDVVTATLVEAGHFPSVAIVDGHTEREPVDSAIERITATVGEAEQVANPPATITSELTRSVVRAIAADDHVLLEVVGEEDLAVLPVILAAPIGATVVYGQPGEGMVAVTVDASIKATVRAMLGHLEGDQETFLALIGHPSG